MADLFSAVDQMAAAGEKKTLSVVLQNRAGLLPPPASNILRVITYGGSLSGWRSAVAEIPIVGGESVAASRPAQCGADESCPVRPGSTGCLCFVTD
jgi:hypothetical protein